MLCLVAAEAFFRRQVQIFSIIETSNVMRMARMGKSHQIIYVAVLIYRNAVSKFGNRFILVELVLLLFLNLLFPISATAQSMFIDAAFDVAHQWLTLADTDQAGQMWEQSAAPMKKQSDQQAWTSYIDRMHSQLGKAPQSRFWQTIEHQIDPRGFPQGEFVGITFFSDFTKVRAWETVTLVRLNDKWVPVGYQYGLKDATPK